MPCKPSSFHPALAIPYDARSISSKSLFKSDNVQWAPHEILGSWLLKYQNLLKFKEQADPQQMAIIDLELNACKEHVRLFMQEISTAGPLAFPEESCDFESFLRKPDLSHQYYPHLESVKPLNVAKHGNEELPIEIEQTYSSCPGLISKPKKVQISPQNSGTSFSSQSHSQHYSAASSFGSDESLCEPLSWTDSKTKIGSTHPIQPLEQPAGPSNFAAMHNANSCDEFDDIGFESVISLPQVVSKGRILDGESLLPHASTHNVTHAIARKRELRDAAVEKAREFTRNLHFTLNTQDNTMLPPPMERTDPIDCLGVIEVEYGVPTGADTFDATTDQHNSTQETAALWQRRGVWPPNPIRTDVREPGSLCMARPETCQQPPLLSVNKSLKNAKQPVKLHKFANRVRSFIRHE